MARSRLSSPRVTPQEDRAAVRASAVSAARAGRPGLRRARGRVAMAGSSRWITSPRCTRAVAVVTLGEPKEVAELVVIRADPATTDPRGPVPGPPGGAAPACRRVTHVVSFRQSDA